MLYKVLRLLGCYLYILITLSRIPKHGTVPEDLKTELRLSVKKESINMTDLTKHQLTYNEWAKSNEWIRALDFLQIASTLAQNNPNDQDLGRKIRSLLKSTEL